MSSLIKQARKERNQRRIERMEQEMAKAEILRRGKTPDEIRKNLYEVVKFSRQVDSEA